MRDYSTFVSVCVIDRGCSGQQGRTLHWRQ